MGPRTLLVLTWILVATTALGQTTGLQWFQWRLNEYQIQLSGDYRARWRQYDADSHKDKYNRGLTRGIVQCESQGSIYHPNLLEYLLNFDLGYNQTNTYRRSVSDNQDVDRGISRNIMFQGRFLRRKPVNLSVEFMRQHQQMNQEIFYVVNSFIRRGGLRLNWQNNLIPVNLAYTNSLNEQLFSNRTISVHEKRIQLISNYGALQKLNARMSANYTDYNRVDLGYYQSRQYRFQFRPSVHIPLDSQNKHILDANAYYSRITGSRFFTNFNTTAKTKSQLTEGLVQMNRVTYRRNRNEGQTSNAQTIATELRHDLFQSLRSSLEISFRRDETTAVQRRTWLVRSNIRYQKALSVGQVRMNVGYQPNWINIENQSREPITDQLTHNFAEQNPVFMERQGILENSIRIWGENGSIAYVRGQDFSVQPYGGTFQVLRLPGSQIPDSGAVIIEFQYAPEQTQQTKYTAWSYGVAYQYDRLFRFTLGYSGHSMQFANQSQNILWNADEKNVDRVYFQVSNNSLSLDLARETSTSQITPYTTNTANLSGLVGISGVQNIVGRVQYVWRELPLRDATQRQTNYILDYYHHFSQRFRLKAGWHLRSMSGDLNEMEEAKWAGRFTYRMSAVTFTLEYNYLKNRFFTNLETNQRWIFSLTLKPM